MNRTPDPENTTEPTSMNIERPPDLDTPSRDFQDLASSYNYQNTPPHGELFVRLLLAEARRRPGMRAADIGCGIGIQRRLHLTEELRAHCDELWGVEPDPTVSHNPSLHTHFQNAFLETADLPENHFDLLYSSMVMEHVADPAAYFAAAHRALRPGGVHMFCTPNGRHLFTRIAKTLRTLRLDDAALRLIRPNAHDSYHYPVHYRCNTPRTIDRLAASSGFARPDYAFVESGGVKSYFPGPLRPAYWLLDARRRRGRRRDILVTLIARMVKPQKSTSRPDRNERA